MIIIYFEKLSKLLDGEKMKKTRKRHTRFIFSFLIVISLLLLTISSAIQINAAYPKQRVYHSLVYDSTNDRVIMYGGATITGEAGRNFETWEYNYNTNEWNRIGLGSSPYAYNALLAYDSESGVIVSFGGSHADHVPSDQTWIYDYSTDAWTQESPSNKPHMRESGLMVYDSESDVVILIGGSLHWDSNPAADVSWRFNDTWSYDYNSNTWTNITSATYPANYQFSCAAYDSVNDLIVVYGGTNDRDAYDDPTGGRYNGETWTFDYDTNTWTNVTKEFHPSPRGGVRMAYDSEHELFILFGGYTHLQTTEIDHETWAFNTNSMNWTQLNPDSTLERRAYAMTYDSESEKVVLFGGNTGDKPYDYLGDTWVFDYDFNNWTKMPIPEVTEDTLMFILPVVISLSFLAVLAIIRRKSR